MTSISISHYAISSQVRPCSGLGFAEKHYQEEQIISYQVVRIEQFTKGSLGKIGGETERTSRHHRNENIDSEHTAQPLLQNVGRRSYCSVETDD